MPSETAQKQLTKAEVRRLLHEGRHDDIAADFKDTEGADLAELVRALPREDRDRLMAVLPLEQATEIFEYLGPDVQKELLLALNQERIALIFSRMAPDNRTALLEALPPQANRRLLTFLKPQERAQAQSLLHYPKNTIGRLITPNFLAIRQDQTIERLLRYIRRNGEDKETLDHIYVVDPDGRLLDDMSVKEILVARPDALISDLMDDKFTVLSARDDQEEAVKAFKRYDQTALPVVDDDGFLIGIVTVDDILDVSEREDTEDMHKLGGLENLDAPYLQAPLHRMLMKRGIWLVILFAGAMFTPTIMSFYEEAIAKAIFLALFIPLVISSGGNSGSQAATLITRALALEEVRLVHWRQVLRRELASGLLLGGLLGLLGFARVLAGAAVAETYSPGPMAVGLAVGLTLLGIVLWGTLIGSMLPFLLKKLNIDPATCSAPFVATVIDLTGIVIFFHISLLFLGDAPG